jgi:hypothetical protein
MYEPPGCRILWSGRRDECLTCLVSNGRLAGASSTWVIAAESTHHDTSRHSLPECVVTPWRALIDTLAFVNYQLNAALAWSSWACNSRKRERKMGSVTKLIASTVIVGAALISFGSSVLAQSEAPSYMGGLSSGGAAGCPTTEWHIKPVPPTGAVTITGVAYFSDMSGISVISGTRTAAGTISGTVTSISGKGPSGKFTGQRTPTSVHVDLDGPGCSHHVVDIHAMPNNFYASPG